jgi:hypothetical protein
VGERIGLTSGGYQRNNNNIENNEYEIGTGQRLINRYRKSHDDRFRSPLCSPLCFLSFFSERLDRLRRAREHGARTHLGYIVNDHRSRRVPKVDRGERAITWVERSGAERERDGSVAKRSVASITKCE